MNSSVQQQPTSEKALRWIGDLDHPFYSDERNRFVWYEASAIGFQILLLGSWFLAGLMLWIGGADALAYGLSVVLLAVVASGATIGYTSRRSADYTPKLQDFISNRGVVGLAVVAFAVTGLIRALLAVDADGFLGGFSDGAVVGLGTGLVAAVLMSVYRSKKTADEDEF